MFNIKNLLMVAAVLLLLVVGAKMLNRQGSSVISDPEENLTLLTAIKEDISKPLPDAGRQRTFINDDQVNKGNKYISSLFEYTTENEIKIPAVISEFIYKGYQEVLSKNVGNFSALTVAILVKGTNHQYRVILGNNIARKKDMSFWKAEDQKALYAWLAEECPRSNPNSLPDFCNLSDLLNPTLAGKLTLTETPKADSEAKKEEVKKPLPKKKQ